MRILILVFLMAVGVIGIALGISAVWDARRPVPSAAPFLMRAFKSNRQIGMVFGVMVVGLGGILLVFAAYKLITGQ